MKKIIIFSLILIFSCNIEQEDPYKNIFIVNSHINLKNAKDLKLFSTRFILEKKYKNKIEIDSFNWFSLGKNKNIFINDSTQLYIDFFSNTDTVVIVSNDKYTKKRFLTLIK